MLKDCNKLMGTLNDNFRCINDISMDKKGHIRIYGVYKKQRKAKHFIIVNNTLLNIVNPSRQFTFQFNGQAGANTKEILHFDFDFMINHIKYDFIKHFKD